MSRRLNKLCAPDISVRIAEWVAPDFDARFSATWRQYRYHVWNDAAPNPLLAPMVWHVPKALEVDAMHRAAADLLGDHDFTSFCRKPKVPEGSDEPSMRRVMHEASWTRVGQSLLRFEVRGSSFCHQQVRSMVGTLVDIGLGRLPADGVPAIFEALDRVAAGTVAPPEGLILWAVGYEGTRWDAAR